MGSSGGGVTGQNNNYDSCHSTFGSSKVATDVSSWESNVYRGAESSTDSNGGGKNIVSGNDDSACQIKSETFKNLNVCTPEYRQVPAMGEGTHCVQKDNGLVQTDDRTFQVIWDIIYQFKVL